MQEYVLFLKDVWGMETSLWRVWSFPYSDLPWVWKNLGY